MGFALWIDDDRAWAQGTSEYRALGSAVIAVTDLFEPRDFRPGRRPPVIGHRNFAGLFASVGDLNQYLLARRSILPRPEPGYTRL